MTASFDSLARETDLSRAIIFGDDGCGMDGMQPVAKGFLEGRSQIEAVCFPSDPARDTVGVQPADLSCD